MKQKFHPAATAISVCMLFFLFSCRPTEEVGQAKYFVENRSDHTLRISAVFLTSVETLCDSCEVKNHETILLGSDAAFGHAPAPDETVKKLQIYRNDTLKKEISPPYPDTLWVKEKGEGRYDYHFTLPVSNKDVE